MPHVDIKCFPRDLTDEQKTALAADIAEAIARHLNSKDRSISVALQEVQEADWKAQVWDTEIGPKLDELIKSPAIRCNLPAGWCNITRRSPLLFPFAKIDNKNHNESATIHPSEQYPLNQQVNTATAPDKVQISKRIIFP